MSQANTNKENPKCKNCETFFANQAFNGLCSKCYKEVGCAVKEKEQIDNKTSVSAEDREITEEFAGLSLKKEEKVQQKDKKRCFNCNKKTGLLGIECKCGYVYCNSHRLPENHECQFNHKAFLQVKLKEKLNKVSNGKVIEI